MKTSPDSLLTTRYGVLSLQTEEVILLLVPLLMFRSSLLRSRRVLHMKAFPLLQSPVLGRCPSGRRTCQVLEMGSIVALPSRFLSRMCDFPLARSKAFPRSGQLRHPGKLDLLLKNIIVQRIPFEAVKYLVTRHWYSRSAPSMPSRGERTEQQDRKKKGRLYCPSSSKPPFRLLTPNRCPCAFTRSFLRQNDGCSSPKRML